MRSIREGSAADRDGVQHFNLFPHKSVLENITLPLRKIKKLTTDGAEAARCSRPWVSGIRGC
jgi:polar amino acid transport system ATP-binding protein